MLVRLFICTIVHIFLLLLVYLTVACFYRQVSMVDHDDKYLQQKIFSGAGDWDNGRAKQNSTYQD